LLGTRPIGDNCDRAASPAAHRDEHTRNENGRSNSGTFHPVRRPHFRLRRHDSLLAGLALLAVILGIVDRDWGLSSEARPRAAGAPDAIRTARRGDQLSPIDMPHIQSINGDDGFMSLVH
jgi:hypothetical protein